MSENSKATVRLRTPKRGECELVLRTSDGIVVCPIAFEQLRGLAADAVEILSLWPVKPE